MEDKPSCLIQHTQSSISLQKLYIEVISRNSWRERDCQSWFAIENEWERDTGWNIQKRYKALWKRKDSIESKGVADEMSFILNRCVGKYETASGFWSLWTLACLFAKCCSNLLAVEDTLTKYCASSSLIEWEFKISPWSNFKSASRNFEEPWLSSRDRKSVV